MHLARAVHLAAPPASEEGTTMSLKYEPASEPTQIRFRAKRGRLKIF